jgi:hypothetical protein
VFFIRNDTIKNIFSLFSQNIWSIKKKAVPLHPISATKNKLATEMGR